MNLVGDVSGRIAIIVDNFIDEVESIVSAARFLKEQGAYKVYATATHGILSDPELLEDSPIEEVNPIIILCGSAHIPVYTSIGYSDQHVSNKETMLQQDQNIGH